MDGQKSNVIEYVFQGDTLNLEQAIEKVSSLLNTSARKLKKYQDGTLTAAQTAQLESTRKLLKKMRALAKQPELDPAQRRQVLAAGREALKQARVFAEQAAKTETKYAESVANEKLRLIALTSTAGQEAAKQNAAFLEDYANRLKGTISDDAYYEVTDAVANFNAVVKSTTASQEELAGATEEVNRVYKQYAKIFGTAVKAQDVASRGITSFNRLVEQSRRYLEATVKSFSFWIQLFNRVGTLLKEGVADAAAYVESVNYLTVVTGEYNEELERFIELQEKAFGADPAQLRTTAATFFQIGKSIGWSEEQAAILSKTYTQLAQDMASLQNVSLEVATEKLRAGLTGQSKALKAWGIDVQDATIEEWLLTKGIQASMASMNEASQTAARYAYILDVSSAAQGDLARTLRSPANQLKILRTQTELLFQNLASFGIPVVASFARVVNAVLQPVNAFLKALTASAAEEYTKGVGEGTSALEGMEDQAQDTAAGLTDLDEINMNQSAQFSVSGSSSVYKELEKLIKTYENGAAGMKSLTDAFSRAGEALAPLFEMMTSSPLDFSKALTFLAGALEIVLAPLEWFSSIFQKMPKWMQDTVGGLTQVAGAILTTTLAMTAFKMLSASKVFSTFISILSGMWSGFVKLTKAIIANTASLFSNKAETLRAKAASMAMGIVLWWETAAWWQKAIAVIAAAGALAGVVAAIALGSAAVAQSQASSQLGQQTSVPGMATGGVVTGPTLALVGEGDYDEAVVPLGNSPQFKAMKNDIAAQTARHISYGSGQGALGSNTGSGGSGRPIILQLNGREVARGLLPDMQYVQKQTGVKFQ